MLDEQYFRNILRKWREKTHCTKKFLSEEVLGASENTYRYLEDGKTGLQIRHLVKLINYYGVGLAEFFELAPQGLLQDPNTIEAQYRQQREFDHRRHLEELEDKDRKIQALEQGLASAREELEKAGAEIARLSELCNNLSKAVVAMSGEKR